MPVLNVGLVYEQLRIIAITAERGRTMTHLDKQHRIIDSFQHIQDEAERTMKWLDPTGEYGKQYL